MCQWTHLEYEITRGIQRVFGLIYIEGAIITGNIQVRDKISILRTAVEFYSRDRMSNEWRAEAVRLFTKIADIVPDRNLVAHTYFEPTDDGDIRFVRVRAKTAINEVQEIWTEEIVNAKCAEMNVCMYDLAQLMGELLHREGRYLEPRSPNGLLDPLTPLYPPPSQPQENQNSEAHLVKRRTPARTSRKPQK
jgi:hypothetical protein